MARSIHELPFSFLRRVLMPAVGLCVLVAACGASDDVKDEDKSAPDEPFDGADFFEDVSFTAAPAPLAQIDHFFTRTPYERARRSFLASYYSNGYSTAFGLSNAATKYRVSPRLLLAFVQARQGLISMTRYPVTNPMKVEYAFDCGCASSGVCEYSMGGLDRQFDCLASQLRTAYDDARLQGKTARGYGVGIQSLTTDGVLVTPVTNAVAAIYEVMPRHGEKDKSGAWLVWRVATLISELRGESVEGTASDQSEAVFVGASCSKAADCDDGQLQNAQCRKFGTAASVCTVPCSSGACLDTTTTGEAGACISDNGTNICMPKCDISKKGECGEFVCTPRKDPGGVVVNVCVPGGVT